MKRAHQIFHFKLRNSQLFPYLNAIDSDSYPENIKYEIIQNFKFGSLERLVWKSSLDKNYGVLRRSMWKKNAASFRQTDIEKNQVKIVSKNIENITSGIVISETEKYVVIRDRAVLKVSDGKNKNPSRIFLEGHFRILKENSPFGVKIVENPLQIEGAGIDLKLSLNDNEITNVTNFQNIVIDMNVPGTKLQKCGVYPGYFTLSDLSKALVYCEPDIEQIIILPFYIYKIKENGFRELVLKSNFRIQPDWTKKNKLVDVKSRWKILSKSLNELNSDVIEVEPVGEIELRHKQENSFHYQFKLVNPPRFGSIFLYKYQKLKAGDTFTKNHL